MNCKDRLRQIQTKFHATELATIALCALCLNIIIELLGRETPFQLLNHILSNTIFFIYNVLILALTLSISLFFRRKRFVMSLIAVGWLSLGIANYVVLSYRITPFAAIDLFIMQWDLTFIKAYLNLPLAMVLIVALVAGVYAIVRAFQRSKGSAVHYRKALVNVAVMLVVTVGMYQGFLHTGVYEPRISNMQSAYSQFGFVSCFTRSAIERGIDEPTDYSKAFMDNFLQEVQASTETANKKPNVVVVQLESFFNPNLLADTTFSKNPIPNYTALCQNNSSGALNVAVVGAGTANTEFEVLTGMSVDFFGTGEYPYETVVRDRACYNTAYALKDQEYGTFAIHNNTGTFYDRYLVYPNLGFDHFVSSEFMQDLTTTPNDWVKDKHLTKEIFNCMNSTDQQDFVFAVSVQGHGSFPEEEMTDKEVAITASPFEEPLENQVEYYVNQLYEMDLFIGELVEQINQFDEPTMLVLYGDHIPSLELEASDLITHDNYQTSYVIHANYDMDSKDQELSAYQLMANALQQAGIDGGVVAALHQENVLDRDYFEQLEALQYDLLYGEQYALEGATYQPTDLQMGIGQMTFTIADTGYNMVRLSSDQLTDHSEVYVNDKKMEIAYRVDHTLYLQQDLLQPGDVVVIKQVSDDRTVLAESKAMIY